MRKETALLFLSPLSTELDEESQKDLENSSDEIEADDQESEPLEEKDTDLDLSLGLMK